MYLDETGITNVHVPQKVLAAKKNENIRCHYKQTKGENITVVCAISATVFTATSV
jgi:hypothetical protein